MSVYGGFLRHILGFLFLITVQSFVPAVVNAQSCVCERLECGPCEITEGTTLYTEKCDGGKRTKSCQRPTCKAPIKPFKGCEGAQEAKSQADEKEVVLVKSSDQRKLTGHIILLRGNVFVTTSGTEKAAKLGMPLYERDVIVTSDEAVTKVKMLDGNIINLSPNSRVKLRAYEDAALTGQATTTIDLIFGKMRSQVVTKPKNPNKPHFIVRTPSAVAGVRGTDFITTHIKNGDVTKIETLGGTVELGGHSKDDKTLIKKGQYASYVVVATSQVHAFNDDDIGSFIHKGFLTPVYHMSDFQIEKLDIETDFKEDGSDRIIAQANNAPICSSPTGDLNQCAWICQNNPDGQTKCRTDLAGVKCVRAKCDANGKWKGHERLPASAGATVCGTEPIVGPCDY